MAERALQRLLWLAPDAPAPETARAIGRAGWQVLHVDNSDRVADWISRLAPDLLVLQLHQQAAAWLHEIRPTTVAPIVVLTPTNHESEQSQLFEAGADAVLQHGASPRLLMAWLTALQRLRAPAAAQPVHAGALLVPPLSRGVRWGPQLLDLSPAEQALLHELVRWQGHTVSRSALRACLAPGLAEERRTDGAAVRERTVDMMISRLRRRLARQAVHAVQIRAVHGVGYRLTCPAAAGA